MTSRWILKLSTTKKWERLSSSPWGYNAGETDAFGPLGSEAVMPVDEGGVTMDESCACRPAGEWYDSESVDGVGSYC
jgi:hypothetical protein